MASDNKKLKKQDKRRMALRQDHERDYLLLILGDVEERMASAVVELHRLKMRIRAGYPKAKLARRAK